MNLPPHLREFAPVEDRDSIELARLQQEQDIQEVERSLGRPPLTIVARKGREVADPFAPPPKTYPDVKDEETRFAYAIATCAAREIYNRSLESLSEAVEAQLMRHAVGFIRGIHDGWRAYAKQQAAHAMLLTLKHECPGELSRMSPEKQEIVANSLEAACRIAYVSTLDNTIKTLPGLFLKIYGGGK